jgi:hypothetical protein
MEENPLIHVVRPLPPQAREAMHAAASAGPLQRHTWNGCVFNRAGALLGECVQNHRQAAKALGTSRRSVVRFVFVWDGLGGSDERCTELLIEALEAVGRPTEPAGEELETDADAGRPRVGALV